MNLFSLYLITALNLVHMFGLHSLWIIPLNNCRVYYYETTITIKICELCLPQIYVAA